MRRSHAHRADQGYHDAAVIAACVALFISIPTLASMGAASLPFILGMLFGAWAWAVR